MNVKGVNKDQMKREQKGEKGKKKTDRNKKKEKFTVLVWFFIKQKAEAFSSSKCKDQKEKEIIRKKKH